MKNIPKFENQEQEIQFWSENDSTDFLDWEKAEQIIFPNLKPTMKSISIRLPEYLLVQLKTEANKLDIPYQSLMKIFIKNALDSKLTKQSKI